MDGGRVVGVITRNGLLKALARKDHQLVRGVMHRDIAVVDASGGFPKAVIYIRRLAGSTGVGGPALCLREHAEPADAGVGFR